MVDFAKKEEEEKDENLFPTNIGDFILEGNILTAPDKTTAQLGPISLQMLSDPNTQRQFFDKNFPDAFKEPPGFFEKLGTVSGRMIEDFEASLNAAKLGDRIEQARIISNGFLTTIPVGVIPTTSRVGGIAIGGQKTQTQLAREAERIKDIGGDPTLLSASKSRAVGLLAETGKKFPFVDKPITRGAQATIDELENATAKITKEIGTPLDQPSAGNRLLAGLDRFARQIDDVVLDQDIIDGTQVDKIIAAPARMTSFLRKAQALFSKVDIPAGTPVSLENTKKTLQPILNKIGDPKLNELIQNPKLKIIFERISNPNVDVTFEEARLLRREIWALSKDSELSRSIGTSEVRKIYGAFTQDLQAAADTAGVGAAFSRAERFFAAGKDRIAGKLQKLFQSDTPEQAFKKFELALRARDGDVSRVAAIKRVLRPEEWNDLTATIITKLGAPKATAEKGATFSANNFFVNFKALGETSKDLLFSGNKEAKELLNKIVDVSGNIRAQEKLANPSGTVSGLATIGIIGFAIAEPGAAIGALAGGRITANLITSPRFLKTVLAIQRAGQVNLKHVASMLAAANLMKDNQTKDETFEFIKGMVEENEQFRDDPKLKQTLLEWERFLFPERAPLPPGRL